MKTYKTIDDYINAQDVVAIPLLKKMRSIIQNAAPIAKEKISYGMPAFF